MAHAQVSITDRIDMAIGSHVSVKRSGQADRAYSENNLNGVNVFIWWDPPSRTH